MSSNVMAGERRWASARRGGMTFLGKVAVPKPLNLPSQRLENHGLDPNVEIVPKGTLSWGSRPSSSGSNPWVSSSLSPNADGGTVSPSHVSGRPSSGGSGTRPSTAGSDRTQEPVSHAWGSNSRPSSASGTLSSSQTSSSTLRPRSAENRPNSSQLSRFAEPMSKSSVAWGPSSTAERLGVKPSKEDGFSLSSGDFPSLGSEKDNLGKNIEADPDRPSSASSRIASGKEDSKSQDDLNRGIVNTWTADGIQSGEDDIRPSMEKWQGDYHQYINNNTPQHFGPWHGPPVNGPGGVWYGGCPRGPPFGAPVPPGGFPGEPFPYYHHQMPPPPLAGSQAAPHRGAGPRGPHPKNGDLYRPQVPDNYVRPGMPFRPGFYPGPHGHHAPPGPMGFEGYYGPGPMGFCNSEQDVSYMGMAAGGPVYSGFPGPRPDIGDSHARAGYPFGKPLPGQVEADRLDDTQGMKRASLKKHYQYDDQRDEGENHENMMQRNMAYSRKGRLPVFSNKKNEWGAEVDAEEAMSSMRQTPNESPSHGYEYQVRSTGTMNIKTFEGTANLKVVKNSEDMQSFSAEMLPLASEKDSLLPAVAKNSVLMHKIDGLNAKVRISDGRNDSPSAKRDEERNKSRVPDMKNNYAGSVGNTEHFERTAVSSDSISGTGEVILSRSDTRRSSQGGQGRTEHRGKGKFISQDADGWRRKPVNTESSSTVIASNIVTAPSINEHGTNVLVDDSENSVINLIGRTERDSVEAIDSTDNQRAKMRELAKQRALQLQKEEEERIREQKAKALAKLEELNRRTIAEVTNQKADQILATGNNSSKHEELPTAGEFVVPDQRSHVPGFSHISNPGVTIVDNDKSGNRPGESVRVSRNLPQVIQNTGIVESDVSPLLAHDDGAKKEASQFNDGGISRPRRTGHKYRHNTLQKSLHEKSVSDVVPDVQRDHSLVATVDSSSHVDPSCESKLIESNVLDTSNTVVELPTGHHRKKINRPSKYKYKVSETHVAPALAPASDTNPGKELIESGKSKDSLSNINSSDSTVVEHHREVSSQDYCSSLPNEESEVRVSNQRKHNPSRKLPRNQQSNRFTDKLHGSDSVVWAPVRPQNKGSVDANENCMQESANPTTKGTNMSQSSSKGKRAEIERYVPKPVAKELAQQGSITPISASTRSNEGPATEQTISVISARPQPLSTVTAFAGSNVDINEGDGNHNKHQKDCGMWKQQDLTDSSHAKGLYFGTIPISEVTKDIQQSENVHFMKSESSGGISASGGHSVPNNTTADTVNKYPSVKDQQAAGRGKINLSKGSRSTGNHPDPENGIGDEVDGSIQSAAPTVNQTDRGAISKEGRSFGEWASSQWQPKSQSNAVYNQHEDRHAESESVNTLLKKDHPQRKVQAPRNDDKDSVNATKLHPGQSVNVESNAAKSDVGRHQETEREKKPAAAKGQPYSPNQEPLGSGESAPTSGSDHLFEHNVPSGSRRNPRQNNRPYRGHESRGEWAAGHENRQHNNTSFKERPRHNAHYKYQPVGPFKSNNPEKAEELVGGGGENVEQMLRSRGQGHARRGGHFYKRQTSTSHVDSQTD